MFYKGLFYFSVIYIILNYVSEIEEKFVFTSVLGKIVFFVKCSRSVYALSSHHDSCA